MRNLFKIICVSMLAGLFLLLYTSPALASLFLLAGTVHDESSNPLPATIIDVIDPGTENIFAQTTTDMNGGYEILVDEGTYDVRASPPAGSEFQPVTALAHNIQGNSNLDFVLARTGVVTLSGRVTDVAGNPVSSTLYLRPAGFPFGFSLPYLNVGPDASGNYSAQVAPGIYQLMLSADNGSGANVPASIGFIGSPAPTVTLTEDMTLDLVLDAKRIDVHVEDSVGNPIVGASLQTNAVTFHDLSVGMVSMAGTSGYTCCNGGEVFPVTDSSGNATLWLFSTPPGETYTILVTPPEGSDLSIFWIPGFSVVTAKNLLVSLQVPAPLPSELYLKGGGPNNNPPTVFLEATAPTTTTAKFKDSPNVKFGGGNLWKEVGTWAAMSQISIGEMTTLSNLHVWLGLKNSDDQGTRFDVRAEVYKNGTVIASGESYCIQGLTRNANNALEQSVAFAPFAPTEFNGATDILALKVLTRIGTDGSGGFCGGHRNAVGLRLYFDAESRASKFDATFEQ